MQNKKKMATLFRSEFEVTCTLRCANVFNLREKEMRDRIVQQIRKY